jgi:hypothetical protein
MSTKTLLKRLALGTVVAVSAGVLSVVSTTSAHANILSGKNIYDNSTDGTSDAVNSQGLVGSSVSNGVLAQTATILAGGKIAVGGYSGTAATAQNITVSGGTFSKVSNTGTGAVTPTITAPANTTATADAAAAGKTNTINALATPNSGSTSMTITIYDGSTSTSPVAVIVVAVDSTNQYNVFSAAKSTVYWGTGSSTDTATADATSSNYSVADGGTVKGYITLKDGYGNPLTSAAKALLTITTTADSYVDASTSTKGSNNVAYVATAVSTAFNIQQKTAHAGVAATVTIAINGTVFATKTATIAGEVASIKVTPSGFVAKTGGSNNSLTAPVASYAFYDGAGNKVYKDSSATTAVSSTLGSVVSNLSVSQAPSDSATGGYLAPTCASSGKATGLKLQVVNPSGTIVTSNAFDLYCGGSADTYKAAFDTSKYSLGGLATLTITFYDSKGNLANGYDAITGSNKITVANAPGSSYVTAPATGDLAQSGLGTKTYQFPVTVVDGSYQAVISVPDVNSGATGANQTVAYTVATGGTSLNDVLKGIVSLIASINKQIAALAKLVAPKKK